MTFASKAALLGAVFALPLAGLLVMDLSRPREITAIVFQVVCVIAMFGCFYRLGLWLSADGKTTLRQRYTINATQLLLAASYLLIVSITLLSVSGWQTFQSAPRDLEQYRLVLFGFSVFSFRIDSILGYAVLHPLAWPALLLTGAVSLQALRRNVLSKTGLGSLFGIGVVGLVTALTNAWWAETIFTVGLSGSLLWLCYGDLFRVFCFFGDAPTDQVENNGADFGRRYTLKLLLFAGFALWVGPLLLSLRRARQNRPSPKSVALPSKPIANVDQVPIGGVKAFVYPESGDFCLLMRISDDDFVAYNQKCTHRECAVLPQVSEQRLRCPCHGGYYALSTGEPIAGPPQRRLTRIVLEKRGQLVYAVGLE